MLINHDTLYIGGEWIKPTSKTVFTPINPSTREPVGQVPEAAREDIDAAVAAAREAFDRTAGWPAWSPEDRAEVMDRLADAIEGKAPELTRLVSSQNGMPITIAGQLESAFPVAILRFYAGLARGLVVSDERSGLFGGRIEVRRHPVGVVAAIVPWNYPQALTMLKLAPALAAGCTVVLKPAPETVLDAQVLAEAAVAAGLPAGVLNVVPAGRDGGAYLVEHPGVDKVAFTGSTAAGRVIGATCGRLLRPVTLELGGKSAAVILDDADLDLSVVGERLFAALLINNGQTCFIGSRVLAPRRRLEEIEGLLGAFVSSLVVGDALDPITMIGPLVSEAQRTRVEYYIARGQAEGGRLVTGGGRPAGLDGFFVEPTVFSGLDNTAAISREEIFGPVLTVIPYDTDEDAVRIANDSEYGLAGSVWTSDPERGAALARRIHTGTIGINGYLPDPVAPFGGMKASGLGRELGPEGLVAYQAVQSIYLDR